MNAKHKNCVILLTGIDKDFDRAKLREEFSQFGDISRLYIHHEGRYAKVYFPNPIACYQTYNHLKTNPFMWKLYYLEDRTDFINLEKEIISRRSPNLQASQNNLIVDDNRRLKMYDSNNPYSEGEAQLNEEYCNIHGEPLDVFESDTGDLFINLKDIARTGFSIFRRDTFHSLRIRPDQITQEFECFLLSEAAKYILQHRAHSIDEDRILRTIENVKRKLIGSAAGDNNSHFQNQDNFKRQIEFRNQPDFRNSYRVRNQSEFRNSLEFRNQIDSRNQSDNRNWLDSRTQQEFRHWSTVDNRLHHGDSKYQSQNNRNQMPDNRCGSESRSRSRSGSRKQGNQISNVWSSPFGDMQKSMHQTPRLPRDFPQMNSSTKEEKRDTTNHSNDSNAESHQSTTTFNVTNEIRKPKIPSSNSSTSSEIRSPTTFEKMEKYCFDIGNIYEVKVCYPEPEKDNICWVYEKQSMNQLQDLMFQICEIEPSLEPLKAFNRGQLVLGLYDEVWWRARVMQTNSNMVHFLDYGNKCPAEAIKPLPDNFKKTPAFAVRLVVNRVKIPLEEGKEFSVKVNKKYDDDTYLVDALEDHSSLPKEEQSDSETNLQASLQIEQKNTHSPSASVIKDKPVQMIEKQLEVVEKAQTEAKEVVDSVIPKPLTTVKHKDKPAQITEKKSEDVVYFDIPKPLTTVKHGDVVVIVECSDGKLYLKTKECIDKGKEINTHIKELDKSELVMNSVKEGQLVLCSREGWVSLFRAVVVEKQDSLVVKVCYLDVFGTDTVSVKSLRNVDEYLSKQPALMLSTPDLTYLKDISIAGNNHIAEIIQRKEKLTVEFSNNQIDFRQENGELLSMALSVFKKPSKAEVQTPPKQNATAAVHEKCFYDDMPYIELEPGVHDFICYSMKSASDITLVLQRDDVIEHLNLLVDLKSDNDNPYKPELCEICLVYDDKDDLWYRAVVYNIEDDKYVVYTVDFGMEMSVESDKLRSFPNHLKKVPIIGIGCELAGFPDTPKMAEKIRNIIKEGESLTANVLKLSDETQKYFIEVPGLKEELNKVD